MMQKKLAAFLAALLLFSPAPAKLALTKTQVPGGAVTKVGAETVELRSQEFSKIVVRIEEIRAAAIH